jgi:hypothetical protein
MMTAQQRRDARSVLVKIKNDHKSYRHLSRALSKEIGKSITYQAIHLWYKSGVVPAARVPALARLGDVQLESLRPDLF